MKILGSVIFGALLAPSIASAQFVPVIDINMRTLFPQYMSDFRNIMRDNPDSLRNVISGSNPPGAKYYPDSAKYGGGPPDECELRDVYDMPQSYYQIDSNATNTPWYRATQATDGKAIAIIDVLEFPEIQVNDSVSLSCLLQELVEWKKLDLFLTIHNMIREYISDVQAVQLAQKLEGLVTAANTEWARQGIERCETDPTTGSVTCTTDSVAGVRPEDFTRKLTGARARTLEQRIAGDLSTPAGYTNTCNNWKLDIAGRVAEDALWQTEDSLDTMLPETSCGLTNPINPTDAPFTNAGDFDVYMDNFNTGQYGGWGSFVGIMQKDANTPLTAETQLRAMQTKQLNEIEEEFALERLAPGSLPDLECSGLANDPNCDPRYAKIVTNAGIIGDRIEDYAAFGDRSIAKTDKLDEYAAEEIYNQSGEILTEQGGFDSYNATGISALEPQLDDYIREFYGAIEYGYFDLFEETQDWAQGALLNVYDTMTFQDDLSVSNQAIPTVDTAVPVYDEY